ncbi:hypothetical protein SAMN05444285_1628 [Draconibacterium orientale]|uniref:Uncharacterized protein n=1 Tax=Draconibacterium orientale TaxID=1168034 RepID=A0A1I0JZB3_9BACT|nr:hypothetical protein [Draconibacterium orientale]SEU15813.1 hypothetical protein SAMN05444285_1628 [Draconibacterium orientale]
MYNSTIKTFSEVESFSAIEQWKEQIKKKIESETKEYILGVEEEDYINFLIEDFKVTPLVIYEESEQIDQPKTKKETMTGRFRDYEYEQDVYIFTVRYTFSGSIVLFKIRPSTWAWTSYDISVNEHSNTVSFSFKLYDQDAEKFKAEKSRAFSAAFTNVVNVNNFAKEWNNSVEGIVRVEFKRVKERFLKENDFFAAINISTNKNTDSIFSVPTVKKVDIPQPKLDKNREFASVPTMSQNMYSGILKVVYDAGKSMEKKPALYKNKDEEGLRDQFLFILETRYEGVTATGETFNKNGKTDIILKYSADNSNLFVAECKFWKGTTEFHQAINQLFDRYLTWRDSKVALLFFVQNKDFSKVLETVKEEAKKHPYYRKVNNHKGESSFGYIYRLPNDEDKEVFLEIILFHFDQK